jgi:MYXO-CTERM domain-containing protein
LIAACLVSRPATAYHIETVVTEACHEKITIAAWRRTAEMLPQATAPLPSQGEDEPMIADVPFTVPEDLDDVGVVTLLLGIRDNDIKSHASSDLGELPSEVANPDDQLEHCLRAPEHDEPTGSRDALDACHGFIRETLMSALDGLDAEGRPDGNVRQRLKVHLAIRGEIEVSVPVFHLRAGRGLHAIQDGFSHTFRRVDDARRVTVVLNFAEFAENEWRESRDGPAHRVDLDRCDDADQLRAERRKLAIEASTVALTAMLDSTLDRSQKQAAIDGVIRDYLSLDVASQCTAANEWCDAPENKYSTSACGCHAVGAGSKPGELASFVVLLALITARRRRALAAPLAGFFACLPSAQAEDDVGGLDKPVEALEGKSKAATKGREDPAGSFFARVAAGASIDDPGFSGGAGLRYQVSRPLMLGFDAEWNPWIAEPPGEVRSGALNAYFSAIRRFQLKTESLNVRTTASLGASILLFDIVGARAGSVGPFFGLSLLGAEWKAAPGIYLTIDPTYIALPMPHLTGTPFLYMQYRFLVGAEFGG